MALKVLHPQLAATLGPERFLLEISLTAKLRHPHILPLFDSGEAAGPLWYTMPYIEGESLRQRMSSQGRLSLEDAVRIAGDVLAALAYAHEHGSLHRDINRALTSMGVDTPALADEERTNPGSRGCAFVVGLVALSGASDGDSQS